MKYTKILLFSMGLALFCQTSGAVSRCVPGPQTSTANSGLCGVCNNAPTQCLQLGCVYQVAKCVPGPNTPSGSAGLCGLYPDNPNACAQLGCEYGFNQ